MTREISFLHELSHNSNYYWVLHTSSQGLQDIFEYMGPGGSPLPISTTQTSSISLCDHQCNIIVCATITDHNVTIDNCHKIETFFLDDKQIN